MDEFESGIDRAQKKFKSFSDNISGLSDKVDKAYKGVGDVLKPAMDGFEAVEGVGKKAGNAITTGLKGFATAATAVGGFGAAAVKSGMQFDATMSEVSAISGATGQEFDALRDKALEMGAKTKFSASEAGEAMTYMGMAGWKAGDMISGIEGIMNLAAASGEDLALTSDIVTDALTAFGKSAGDSGHLADIMAAASSNANTNVAMLGESFKYVAPVAGALGYSMEDTSLALGLMANSGIKASAAGTSLRSALTNMASPTKNMAAVMDTYGISLTNADGSMMSLQEVMIQLREKMGGLDEATQASAASMLFGKEAMSGMLAIINSAPGDFEKLTGAIYDCNGAAEEMAATMIDNLQGDLTLLGSAFESLQIAISDSLTPTLRQFAQFGSKVMAELLDGFQSGGVSGFMSTLSTLMPGFMTGLMEYVPDFANVGVQFITAISDGLINSSGPMLAAAGEVISTLTNGLTGFLGSHSTEIIEIGVSVKNLIANGFTNFIDAVSPYISEFVPLLASAFMAYHETLFTVGVDILGAIGRGLTENQDEIKTVATETIYSMVTALSENAPDIIEGGLALLEALVGAIEENMPLILETGGEIIGRLIEGISTASPGVQAIIGTAVLPHILKIIDTVGKIGGAVSSVVGIIQPIISGIVNFVSGGITTIIGIGSKLMGGIQALFGLIAANPVVAIVTAIIATVVLLYTKCEWFRDAVHAVIDAVVGFFQGAWDMIVSVWNAAGEFFSGIVDGIKSVFEGIGEFLGGLFEAAWEAVQAAWGAAVDFFSGVWEAIQSVFSTVAEVLGGFFSAAWDAIKGVWDAVGGFFSEIADGIHGAFEAVTGFLGEAFSAAWDAISGVWEAAVDFFSGVWDGITGVFDVVAEWFGDMFTQAWEAITSAWDGVTEFFGGVWEDITGVFADVWDKFKEIGGNIVGGIKDGILGAWEAFTGWLNEKVGGIVDAVKNMLGIHSPSKVFAGIGENMALGLAEGWNDEYSDIKRKIESGLDFGTTSIGLDANYYGAARYGAQEARRGGVSGMGDTYVTINSPVAVDGVQAAREWQKTAQRMALGYV